MHQICDGYNPRVRMGNSTLTQATGSKNPTRWLSLRAQTQWRNQGRARSISVTWMPGWSCVLLTGWRGSLPGTLADWCRLHSTLSIERHLPVRRTTTCRPPSTTSASGTPTSTKRAQPLTPPLPMSGSITTSQNTKFSTTRTSASYSTHDPQTPTPLKVNSFPPNTPLKKRIVS